MQQYLIDVEDAVTRLIDSIYIEANRIRQLREQVAALSSEVEQSGQHARHFNDNPELDDEGSGTANYWYTYFGTGEIEAMQRQSQDLEQQMANRQASIEALAGALLQIAKQGISLHAGGLGGVPSGRNIGSQSLRTVIWQGRNQAMHYDDQKLRQPVLDCFAALEMDFGASFSLNAHPGKGLAFRVVDLLHWTTFGLFAADLNSLAPVP